MKLAGRHAIVTGGGTGIGAAIARALAEDGAKVTLVGRRLDKLEATATRIRSSRAKSRGAGTGSGVRPSTSLGTNEGVFSVAADVTDRAQVDAAFAAARGRHGPISILVNNAGAAHGVPFAKVTEELWRDLLAVNLDSLLHCCQAALADLRGAEQGRIVTIASMAGLHGFAYASPYIAAKHGAVGLMRALAAEYAGTGLTANAVCPGFVDTEMTVESVANIRAKTGRSEEEARGELAKLNPGGRLILPDEVAGAALALILSDRNGEAVEIA